MSVAAASPHGRPPDPLVDTEPVAPRVAGEPPPDVPPARPHDPLAETIPDPLADTAEEREDPTIPDGD